MEEEGLFLEAQRLTQRTEADHLRPRHSLLPRHTICCFLDTPYCFLDTPYCFLDTLFCTPSPTPGAQVAELEEEGLFLEAQRLTQRTEADLMQDLKPPKP